MFLTSQQDPASDLVAHILMGSEVSLAEGSVVVVQGGLGFGKRTLIQQAINILKEGNNPVVFLHFHASDLPQMPVFIQGFSTTHLKLEATLNKVMHDIARAGGLSGHAIKKCCSLFMAVEPNPRWVVILEDFDAWSNFQVAFFQETFYGSFGRNDLYLITGTQGVFDKVQKLGLWSVSQDCLINLRPWESNDITLYAQLFNINLSKEQAQTIFQASGGVPEKVSQIIEEEFLGQRSKKNLDEWVYKLSRPQQQWAFFAAHHGDWSLECLKESFPLENPQDIMKWLQVSPINIKPSTDGKKWIIAQEDRSSIVNIHLALDESNWHFVRESIRIKKDLKLLFPEEAERLLMVRLSFFQFFDDEAVRDVFSDSYPLYLRLLKKHPQYFKETKGGVLSLVQLIRTQLIYYREYMDRPSDFIVEEKIKNYWKAKEATLKSELVKHTNMLLALDRDNKKITQRIEDMNQIIAQEEGRVMQLMASKAGKKTQDKAHNCFITSLMVECTGVILLYMAFFLNHNMHWFYGGVGLLLVAWGIFLPQARSVTQRLIPMGARSSEICGHSKHINNLITDKKRLMDERTQLLSSIRHSKSIIEKVNSVLAYPFV